MKFKLTIDHSSHLVEHPRNVAAILMRVAKELEAFYPAIHDVNTHKLVQNIRAVDGQVVGTWELTEELF